MPTSTSTVTPVSTPDRITNLDAIRGFAVLGILAMNAVSFGFPTAVYWNLDARPGQSWLDWAIGITGEVFADQKMMGLFSMLFGAGIALFADRAKAKGRRPLLLSIWRNLLLLGIGLVHSLLWEGDILMAYALCAPFIIAARKLPPRLLVGLGAALTLTSALVAVLAQGTVDADGVNLGPIWLLTGDEANVSDGVGIFFYYDIFSRALGMMLLGVGLFKLGVLHGTFSTAFYSKMVRYGFGLGIPLSLLGLAIQTAGDFGPSIAMIGEAPNTLATIPMVMGYVGLIILWNQKTETGLHRRVRAAGRMALTNYLTQTIIGIFVLRGIFERGELNRSWVALFVVCVWLLQLTWSLPWLSRFRFGPFEWLWRSLTYFKIQPLRR